MSSRCKTYCPLSFWVILGGGGGGGGGRVGCILNTCLGCVVSTFFMHLLPFPINLGSSSSFSSTSREGTTYNLIASSLDEWKFVGHSINHGQKTDES